MRTGTRNRHIFQISLTVLFIAITTRADERKPLPPQSGSARTLLTPTTQAPVKSEPAVTPKTPFASIYGYVEGGYMHDFTSPGVNDGPTFIFFNSYKDRATLDKVSLNAERAIDPAKKQFDMGFHLEGVYGADAAFIHSNGMQDTQTGRNQWDLLQAYVDVSIPGKPLRIRAGKWIELAGFEQPSANIYGAFGDPARALYSYSYQFCYAEPSTQTGILVTGVLNPRWTFDAGVTRGWNQSLRDANNAPDFLGRVSFTPSDRTAVIFVMTEGPEFPIGAGKNLPAGDSNHWWTALDLVLTRKVTDKLSLGMGLDYVGVTHVPGLAGGARQWGGAAGYVSYAINPRYTLNTRLEWFKDAASGFSAGAPFGAHFGATYTEATMGLAIRPFRKHKALSHFLLLSEVRYDHADRAVFGKGDHSQATASIGAVFTF